MSLAARTSLAGHPHTHARGPNPAILRSGMVSSHGLDGQVMLSRQLGGHGQQQGLDVQPYHAAAGADPGVQLGQDAEHAAADIDHVGAGGDADAVEQIGGLGTEELGLGQQMADLGRTVAQPVPLLRRRRCHVRRASW